MICKFCGSRGLKVLPLTLGAHLKEEHWDEIDENFYFCPSPDCEIVYFNNLRDVYFTKSDVRTRVGIKEKEEPKPLCYCNRVTERKLLEAVEKFGLEKAIEITRVGKGRWCVVTNPSGRCCEWYLRDYIRQTTESKGKRFKLRLRGLSCEGCVSVAKAAMESAGARVLRISLEEAEVEAEDVSKCLEALRSVGYDAEI
ncbi:MAG: hypothetical protein ABWW66_00585 [Archaeoglobaceae archaeon]